MHAIRLVRHSTSSMHASIKGAQRGPASMFSQDSWHNTGIIGHTDRFAIVGYDVRHGKTNAAPHMGACIHGQLLPRFIA